jgi:putative sporulation protein YyaC
MVGTFIEEKNNYIKVYGTLAEPVHALNIDYKLEDIHEKHPNAFIIGIDACLGDEEDIGVIRLRDYAISPGKGVGKSLPSVGDMSIIGIVDSSENSEFFFSRSIRLSLIWDMAKSIENIIVNTYNKLNEINNVAVTI